eukprot:CAMPEP_0117008894 /NCGR_PEP_ID=MMETSP0472-20121206/8241_1 /TAXON_ID=693140 ORGANISM="Tiarina fusus, Strain LIS" /NCGR_SAMPLE_ID=MMETSP0472 /ASSEMBLY_ACC=CAM_ASM_000603 /LENGTH=113 /DNA_ID=CAMNT_0004711053 /DNA_START=165 /DNA_END=504 /DNA_ORIENTATION=-
MAETDILISPHGAQLGSLPFLPDCSQVLEFFPPQYWIPGFYGSLAQAGGSEYYYLYFSDGDKWNETEVTANSHRARVETRRHQFCAPLEPTLNVVDQMVGIGIPAATKLIEEG